MFNHFITYHDMILDIISCLRVYYGFLNNLVLIYLLFMMLHTKAWFGNTSTIFLATQWLAKIIHSAMVSWISKC